MTGLRKVVRGKRTSERWYLVVTEFFAVKQADFTHVVFLSSDKMTRM